MLVFLRLVVRSSSRRGLLFLHLGVRNSYGRGLVFLQLGLGILTVGGLFSNV